MGTIISILEHHGFSGNRLEAIALVNEMRNWVIDCTWTESPDDILNIPDLKLVQGVNKHYHGGLREFIRCA